MNLYGRKPKHSRIANSKPQCRDARNSKRHSHRPIIELLEDRTLLAAPVDLGNLAFDSSAGFVQNGTSYTFNGSDIEIGYASSGGGLVSTLLTVNGSVSFDTSSANNPTAQFTVTGSLAEAVDSKNQALWIGAGSQSLTLSANTLAGGGGAAINSSGAQTFVVDGTQFTASTILLPAPSLNQLDLYGSFSIKGISGLSVTIDSSDYVAYTNSGPAYSVDNISLPIVDTSIFGMVIDISSVGLTVNPTNQTSQLNGTVALPLFGIGVDIELGAGQTPGVAIDSQGDITSVYMTVEGDFFLGGLKLKSAPTNPLALQYVSTSAEDPTLTNVYELSGTIQIATLFNASADLGTTEQPGILISNNSFEVNNLSIFLSPIKLGSWGLNELELNYSEDSNGNIDYGGTVGFAFPLGWSVGGTLEFVNNQLNTVGIEVGVGGGPGVEDLGQGIPVADTGLFLTKMKAEVQNIQNPSNLSVSGQLSFDYGGEVKIAGKTATLLEIEGGFLCSTSELVIQGGAFVGAVSNSTTNDETGLIGSGSGKLTLDWGTRTYSGSLDVELYDETFVFEAGFQINANGSLYIGATVQMNVPEAVPIIGGDHLATADGIFEYNPPGGAVIPPGSSTGAPPLPPPNSFMVGWISLFGQDYGIEYNFGTATTSSNWEFLGNSQINAIKNGGSESHGTWTYTQEFQVPNGATQALASAQWPDDGGSQSLSLQFAYPSGTYQSEYEFLKNVAPPQGDGMQAYAVAGSFQVSSVPISATSITLTLTSNVELQMPDFQTVFNFILPTIDAPVVNALINAGTRGVSLSGAVDETFTNQATVTLFADTTNSGYHGQAVATYSASTPSAASNMSINFEADGSYTGSANWNLIGLPAGTYYLYAVINTGGGNNPLSTPVYSPYSAAVTVQPSLHGQVLDPENSDKPQAGVTVFIDNTGTGIFDSAKDPSAISGVNGMYEFYGSDPSQTTGFTAKSYSVGIVLDNTNFQFEALSSTAGAQSNPQSVKFSSGSSGTVSPQTLDFGAASLAAISGNVFDDLNGDGIQEAGEDGIGEVGVNAGWSQSVSVDANWAQGGHASTTVQPDGSYLFTNLTPGITYTISLDFSNSAYQGLFIESPKGVSSYQVTVGSGQFTQYSGNDFAVLAYQTVTGSVQSILASAETSGQPVTSSPLSNWIIELTPLSGSGTPQTAKTDINGTFTITGVLPGNYSIQEDVQANYAAIQPVQSTLSYPLNSATAFRSNPEYANIVVGDANGDGNLDVFASSDNGQPAAADPTTFYGAYGVNTTLYTGNPYTITSKTNVNLPSLALINSSNFTNSNTNLPWLDIYNGGDNGIVYQEWPDSSGSYGFDQNYYLDQNEFTTTAGAGNVIGSIVGAYFPTEPTYEGFAYTVDAATQFKGGNGTEYQAGSKEVVMYYPTGINTKDKKLNWGTPIYYDYAGGGLAAGQLFGSDYDFVYFVETNGSLSLNIQTMSLDSSNNSNDIESHLSTYVFPSGTIPGQVAIADINGDGHPDVIFSYNAGNGQGGASPNTTIAYWLNYPLNGGIQDSSAPTVIATVAGNIVPNLIVTDLNGDGMPDVAVLPVPAKGQGAQPEIFLNQASVPGSISTPPIAVSGNTSFNLPTLFTNTPQVIVPAIQSGGGGPLLTDPTSLAVGDLNNTGIPDLLISDSTYEGYWELPGQLSTTASTSAQAQNGLTTTVNFVNVQYGGDAQIDGHVYLDSNGNGLDTAVKQGLGGARVFVDTNGNGIFDPGEPSTYSQLDGSFTFAGLAPGTYSVGVIPPSGMTSTQPDDTFLQVVATNARPATDVDFGFVPSLFANVPHQVVLAGQTIEIASAEPSASPSGRTIYYTLGAAPSGASIDPSTGDITFSAPVASPGMSLAFHVIASDPTDPLLTQESVIQITIVNVPSSSNFISALYQQLLARAAEDQGLVFWQAVLNGGLSRAEIVQQISNSTEHLAMEVDQLYLKYLNRQADPQGESFMIAALLNGTNVTQLSATFLSSAEYALAHPDTASYITGLYQDVLGRTADAADLSTWESVASDGASRSQLATDFLLSTEALTNLVEADYQLFLNRSGSAMDLAYWVANLKTGALSPDAVADAFLASAEFYNLT